MEPYDPNGPQQPDYGQRPPNGRDSEYPTPPEPRFPPPPQYQQQSQYPQQYGGPPPYGAPYQGNRPPRGNRGALIGGIIAGILLLCIVVCGVGYFAFERALGTRSILANANATQTAQAQPTPTSTTPPETPVYQDSFTDTPDGWPNDSNCGFQNDGYHVIGQYYCVGPDTTKVSNSDIKVTVQATKIGSNTQYGIVLRHDGSGDFYSFEITPGGQWAFYKVRHDSNATTLQAPRSDTSIKTGTNTSNELRVLAVGSHFTLFVNGKQVGVADDSTYTSGASGVANDDSDNNSEVVFTNFVILQPHA